MKKVEKHKTNKRRRTRMTVSAFCKCATPYYCVPDCVDDNCLYITMDNYHDNMNLSFS